MDDALTHLTTGAMVVYFLEWLKRTRWISMISPETKALNRLISGVAAIVIALGIEWQYDPAVGGIVKLPALTIAVSSGWEAVKQFVSQQLLWDGVVEPTARRHVPLP